MGRFTIVAVPAPDGAALDERSLEAFGASGEIVACGSAPADALGRAGVRHTTLADLGLAPDAGAERIVAALHERADDADVAIAVAGYPLMRAGLVAGLLRGRHDVRVVAPPSSLQVLLMAFDIDLTADLDIVDARSLKGFESRRDSHLVVSGVENAILARAVAERLAGRFPPEHAVVLARVVEGGGFELEMRALRDLPEGGFAAGSAVYVPPSRVEPPGGFDGFVRLIAELRGPDGCPWDRAQTHASLRPHMLEEAYEAVAAIDSGDWAHLAEELGDVLLQVVLHAQVGADAGEFTIDDVVASIAEKIRRRHPHVFGGARAETAEQVAHGWDARKRQERGSDSVMDGVTRALPALARAQKVSRRAVSVGFEWESLECVWEKLHEEIDELKETEPGSRRAAEEIGDVLFTVVNLARKQGLDAEQTLREACDRFEARFRVMEARAAEGGVTLDAMGIDEMEELWRSAKESERGLCGATEEESAR